MTVCGRSGDQRVVVISRHRGQRSVDADVVRVKSRVVVDEDVTA
jgi:hypothetical protein